MTFTGKIRLYLIAIALLPPVLIIMVFYFHSIKQGEQTTLKDATERMRQFQRFDNTYQEELHYRLQSLLDQPEIKNAILMIQSGRIRDVQISAEAHGIDFLEILDSGHTVLVSGHRPGLIGERMEGQPDRRLETIEYDRNGPHAAYAYVFEANNDYGIYTGVYLDEPYRSMLAEIMNTGISLIFSGDSLPTTLIPAVLQKGRLLEHNGALYTLLAGGEDAGYYLTAVFEENPDRPLFLSLVKLTAIVALITILIAIAIGMYITGRAKREIDNLVSATSRIADGDYTTPVMAYEEGEFSQLADSFSDMTARLKDTRNRLATTEKIAAWKAIGQKIAHELKNPLTPIEISADDLRRSYREKRDDFDAILNETTATIKKEVRRMTALIDEFAGFARMGAPKVSSVKITAIIDGITGLYAHEIEEGRLRIKNHARAKQLAVDSDLIQQTLINIIKNSLDSGPSTEATIAFNDDTENLHITIEDNGPGFAQEILDDPFVPYVTTRPGGSGLGLVISQRIVHDHNGTITLYNRKEGGAGVVINLPLHHGQDSDHR
ncbi:MAG: HAMP domain-containing protein [candidate division Zixibacteria bacterium]|nr:HAMP domain-containing protein [candidate division Zixibacteria bacterium]